MTHQPEPIEHEPQVPHHSRLLKAIRQQHGWSQARLAWELSVSVRTVRNWEKGITQPNTRDLTLFRGLLEASMSAA